MSKIYFHTIHQLITKGHRITHEISRELKEFGVSEPQYNVLRVLDGAKGAVTVQDVQARMVQPGSNVTRIVDKLQEKGLVDRSECPTNRRKMDLTITDTGRQFLKKLDRKVTDLHQPVMDKLSDVELKQLNELLKKIDFG